MRRFADEELSPWHRAFAEAAGDDAIVHPVNAVGAVRWNAAFAYLDPARGRENLTILADTLVDRVLLDGDRATAWRPAAASCAPDTVVLAAGAYGSPGILLRSGIGPRARAARRRGADRPRRRRLRLRGHRPALQREAAAFEREQPLFMAQVTIALRSSACAAGLCDLFFFPALDPRARRLRGQRRRVRDEAGVARDGAPERAPTRARRCAIDHGFLVDPARRRRCSPRASRRCASWPRATRCAAMPAARRAPAPTSTRMTHVRADGARLLPPGRHVRDRRAWSTATAASTASTGSSSRTRRSCRRSRAPTRTCRRSRWPSGWPSGCSR